ncbi:MAG: Unknown protein, partial [uncultured Sulfurovum sp.]
MNYKLSMLTLLLLNTLNANVDLDNTNTKENAAVVKEEKKIVKDPETKALELKERKLSLNNTLKEEGLKSEYSELLRKLQKLRWEKELLSEQLELKELETKTKSYDVATKHAQEIEVLEYMAKVESINDERNNAKIEKEKQERALEIAKLKSEVEVFESTKERAKYINTKPVYLDNPLTEDNKLIISDRRISINGSISTKMANEITTKIDYFN